MKGDFQWSDDASFYFYFFFLPIHKYHENLFIYIRYDEKKSHDGQIFFMHKEIHIMNGEDEFCVMMMRANNFRHTLLPQCLFQLFFVSEKLEFE